MLSVKHRKKLILIFSMFLLFFIFLVFPITLIIEEDGIIKIFSTGFTDIIFFDEIKETFFNKKFFFYDIINFEELGILNIRNSLLSIQKGENLIQKQNNKSSAMVFLNGKNDLYQFENYYFNKEWLKDWIVNADIFLKNIYEIEEPLYIIYGNYARSFQVLPKVYVITSYKDIVHELSHYFFGYKVKNQYDDNWAELLSEVNSMLFLRSVSKFRYLNEIELKSIGFYNEPYGKSVLKFLENFNYDEKKIFELEKYILLNFNRLDDSEFEKILETFLNY
ncbi:hypothetical protein [Petrotoga sp. 9PWA.NaAc.5.4]|uniref:hypothetical protein n=1 Tax=Petrotoga sp. 9PWA.NaAc.5.4 TaxID=1434328 RepID=UPI000CC3A2D7|nr:hypothetical protein [Petrotoga sp. 9PWA.NaAc.5.4]PNR92561.1 hypothetical protein X924_09365 [Petrotoga sp. 9PWA.NaAc.5.4]